MRCAAASSSFTCTVISTLLETGLRVSEVCCLRPGDLDTKAGLLHVRHGKGAKRRPVKLGERYLRLLRRYWVLERPGREWLFPAQRLVAPGRIDSQHRWASRPVSPDSVRTRLHRPPASPA